MDDPVMSVASDIIDPLQLTSANFFVLNTTTGTLSTSNGQPYNGPPGGPTTEYANITPDSLLVTAIKPNAFIITGSGNDLIDVSLANGNNVLDGGTGSNLLLGGSGTDTFLLATQGQTASTVSTVAGLHTGDTVTILGVTPSDFTVNLTNGFGLPGRTGLEFSFSAAGQPTTNVVLAGYSTNDLIDGELSQSFGTVAGTPYLDIHVT